jgi:hypothetical protein
MSTVIPQAGRSSGRRSGKIATAVVVTVAGLLAGGCWSGKATPSGFLGNYSGMQPLPEDPSILYTEKPNVDWWVYKRLQIDPVTVYYAPDTQDRRIEPAELKKLTDYAMNAAVEAVKGAYPVVQEPAPDVLRMRAAITDVVPANPLVNVATTAALFVPLDMGGAAIEVEFVDSRSGERLAALVDRRVGFPLHPGDFVHGFTKWGHAKRAFDEWAKLLRDSLDEVHGKKPQ